MHRPEIRELFTVREVKKEYTPTFYACLSCTVKDFRYRANRIRLLRRALRTMGVNPYSIVDRYGIARYFRAGIVPGIGRLADLARELNRRIQLFEKNGVLYACVNGEEPIPIARFPVRGKRYRVKELLHLFRHGKQPTKVEKVR